MIVTRIQADPRRRVLRQQPLDPVGRPDADTVAGLKPHLAKPRGERIDLAIELGPRPANALLDEDHGLAVGIGGDGRLEDPGYRAPPKLRPGIADDMRLAVLGPRVVSVGDVGRGRRFGCSHRARPLDWRGRTLSPAIIRREKAAPV